MVVPLVGEEGLSLSAGVHKVAVTASRVIAAAALFFFLPQIAAAESDITTKLDLFHSVQRSAEGNWLHSGGGSATLKVDQLGNRNVRSSFELSALILPNSTGVDSLQTVSRAYGKFRFESLRGVIGKAPYSWGEGLVLNAADEIFGNGTSVNLMQQEFEDPAAWISSLSCYFGPFSFMELLVNPGLLEVEATGDNESAAGSLLSPTGIGGAAASGIEETRIGMRFVGKPAGIKMEGGYLFDGRDGLTDSPAAASLQEGDFFHRIYLSLQGNLWLNWHLSGSLEIPDPKHAAGSFQDILRKGQLYTAGVYSMYPIGYDDTLSFRIEARVYPDGTWRQDHSSAFPQYGLYNYGEVSYDFGGGFGLLARGLVNPIDLSARITPGFSWNLFQGFTLFGFASLQTGEPLDTYPWEAETAEATETGAIPASPGLAVQLGCSIVY